MSPKEFRQIQDFIHLNTLVEIVSDLSINDNTPDCMWQGIQLCAGKLYVNSHLAHAGDLLHEVGHIVTVPKHIRPLMYGDCLLMVQGEFTYEPTDLAQAIEKYWDEQDVLVPVSDDDTATYWATRAAQSIGLDPSLSFQNGYGKEGMDLWRGFQLADARGGHTRWHTGAFYSKLIATKTSKTMLTWDIAIRQEVLAA